MANIIVISPSESDIQRGIFSVLTRKINQVLNDMIVPTKEFTKNHIRNELKNSETYNSLTNPAGTLRGELGVLDSIPAMEQIVNAIVDNMVVNVERSESVGNNITGGIYVSFLKSNMEEVLSIQLGSFVSEKNKKVDWLNWLLTRGDNIILSGNWFYPSISIPGSEHNRFSGRTGLGFMARGREWKMPDEFSGTLNDNWLTRTFSSSAPIIGNFMSEEFTRRF